MAFPDMLIMPLFIRAPTLPSVLKTLSFKTRTSTDGKAGARMKRDTTNTVGVAMLLELCRDQWGKPGGVRLFED